MNLFDIANEKSRLKELEEQTKENDFWNDQEKSAVVLQKIKILKDKVSALIYGLYWCKLQEDKGKKRRSRDLSSMVLFSKH